MYNNTKGSLEFDFCSDLLMAAPENKTICLSVCSGIGVYSSIISTRKVSFTDQVEMESEATQQSLTGSSEASTIQWEI